MRKPKKFDLVHQTVSPREKVGSGDETKPLVQIHTWFCVAAFDRLQYDANTM